MLTTNTKRSVHEMALEGNQADIADLLETKPDILKSLDESGRVPLHWAVSRGHTDLASWLLERNKYGQPWPHASHSCRDEMLYWQGC